MMNLVNPIVRLPDAYSAKMVICPVSNLCDLLLVSRLAYVDIRKNVLNNFSSAVVYNHKGFDVTTYRNKVDVYLSLDGRFLTPNGTDGKFINIPITLGNVFLFTKLINTCAMWLYDIETSATIFKYSGNECLLTDEGAKLALTMNLGQFKVQFRPGVIFVNDTNQKVVQILVSDSEFGHLFTNVLDYNIYGMAQILNNLDVVSAGIGILNMYGIDKNEVVYEDKRDGLKPKNELVTYDTVDVNKHKGKVRTRKKSTNQPMA